MPAGQGQESGLDCLIFATFAAKRTDFGTDPEVISSEPCPLEMTPHSPPPPSPSTYSEPETGADAIQAADLPPAPAPEQR